MNYMMMAVMVLGGVALVAAVVLYTVSRKFAVEEDPRIGRVAACLPGANCGGCGYAGCAALAEALVKGADAGSLDGLQCPVGGADLMAQIAAELGMEAVASEPMVAVVRCGGTCELRPRTVQYDGLQTCAAVHATCSGETACGYGCLGCGDCSTSCQFGGLRINPETGLPEVDETLCTGCGSCVKACPRHIIELRKRGPKNRRVYVGCMNRDKGAAARKACTAACIGCGKCEKVCKFEAITISGNLSYIDYNKCRLCTKCVAECPTGAIMKVNFPVKQKETEV